MVGPVAEGLPPNIVTVTVVNLSPYPRPDSAPTLTILSLGCFVRFGPRNQEAKLVGYSTLHPLSRNLVFWKARSLDLLDCGVRFLPVVVALKAYNLVTAQFVSASRSSANNCALALLPA